MATTKHPECKSGEIFLTNATWAEFTNIGWRSKRKGKIAYSTDGEVLKELFPVFVQLSELQSELSFEQLLKLESKQSKYGLAKEEL